MSFKSEFGTVDYLLDSKFETRAVDAFSLSIIKAERQARKLFTHVIYQYPSFSESDIPALKNTLASDRKVYFDGIVNGFDQVFPRSLKDIYGVNYDKDLQEVKKANDYRNKIFHGQLTGKDLSRKDLIGVIGDIKKWCETLAKNAKNELGYDGFARNSYRKSEYPDVFQNLKAQINSINDYKDFIRRNMRRSGKRR